MSAKKTTKKQVDELASCVLFAINNFKNKPIFDAKTKTMQGWRQWFERSLEDAGYKLRRESHDQS